MPTLNVSVVDKIATGDGQIIVCDNTDYTVKFNLDAEWGEYNAKTMRVIYPDNNYEDTLFTGDECPLPRLYNVNSIRIGIYAGDLHATAVAVFECRKSVLSEEGQHVQPPEDIYNQIMDAIENGALDGVGIDHIDKTATAGLVDTYTIYYTDETTSTFEVTNGSSIASVAKTSTSGNVDTYTITMTDGSTSTFTVTNGETDLSNAVRFDVSQSKTEEEKRRAQKNIGIREIIYSNEGKAWIAQENVDLPNVNNYIRITKLNAGTEYRIVLKFNGSTSRFSNAKLSTGASSSGVVATFLAADFVGESWVTGKEITYTPESNAIVYFWLQFYSAYTGGTTCSFEIYNKDWEEVNVIEETEEKLQGEIDDNKYEIYLEDEYNLLPPDGYEVNKRIGTSGVVSTETGKVVSDYFEIDPSMGYICNWAKTASLVRGNSDLSGNLNCLERYSFAFFDELKQVIPFSGDTNAPSKAIPPNAKYMRVTIPREDLYPLARVIYGNYTSQPIVRLRDYAKRQVSPWNEANTGFEDFSMVMFGDSITHGSLSVPDKPTSYVDFANDYLHSKIVNCGFGGTRMYGDTSSGVGLFSFAGLCEAIVSDDENKWASRIAYAQTDNTSYQIQLNKLMAVDWTKVKAIGLMYGANDFTNNTPISSTYSDANTSFNGACAYGLKLLLTKYPHLQVLIMTPFDRTATGSDISTLSSVVPNGAGYYMKDYGESLKLVQEKYCCPLVDTRKLFGINEYTIFEYCSDGVHPRTNLGQQRLGWLFAQAVKNNIAPFR